NINIDIMSALPGQTYESYEDTLQKVIALEPEHISAYSLIVEEGTPFYERYGEGVLEEGTDTNEVAQTMDYAPMYLPLPDEETERKMYHKTKTILQKAGYGRYEISNYAKKGYECLHNLTYWTGVEYLGLGIGAASYLKGYRFKNTSDRQWYINYLSGNAKKRFLQSAYSEGECFHPLHEEIQKLSIEERMEEYMFLGLRLKKGVSLSDFKNYFGKTMDEVYGLVIDNLKKESLLLQK
ncbi:MAG: coproporphyrinogen III oxidase, partial [Lachnospiraceae bacterium]|nr:coproporphyrinogen III oxidase [Lachnospiraceae bacterium]